MDEKPRFPIKVVESSKEDFIRPGSGGSGRKIFGKVTANVRQQRTRELESIEKHFRRWFDDEPHLPAVAKVILKKDALAKSHRPSTLFTKSTCPIIGVKAFGELLIGVTRPHINNLMQKIQGDSSVIATANISAIETIEPFTKDDVLGGATQAQLCNDMSLKGNELRYRLFIHGSPSTDSALQGKFLELVRNLDLPRPRELKYGRNMKIYKLQKVDVEHVPLLLQFVGTQSLTTFAQFNVIEMAAMPIENANPARFQKPEPNQKYPVIGIIDTGTHPDDPILSHWRVARYSYIPSGNGSDYSHGSFVAGIAVHGRQLNDERFPAYPVKFVDVAAIPNNGTITEDQLLSILEEVIPKHPEIRFWNLSLNLKSGTVENDSFSDFAKALDRLQDDYNARFVISVGNYTDDSLRTWPPQNLGERDRLLPPADSVRGISVGSLAHLDRPGALVKRDEPSPFSRRGPGAAFIPKPELVHYGGNCKADLSYTQLGVRSLDGSGNISESIGTSFSTPLVTATLSSIEHSITGSVSPCLVRALAVHSAVLRSELISSRELRYKGFGVPDELGVILTCSPWEATLIFEPELRPGVIFQKDSFPIPQCLIKDDSVTGEIVMTLAYDPPLDSSAGAEYCRINVDASLGTYTIGKDGKPHHHLQIWPSPKSQDMYTLYERYQVEYGFKWSPLKVYRRRMPKGVKGKDWNLQMRMFERSNFLLVPPRSQRVALVVTIRDLNRSESVYDETVAKMRQIGWITQDLQVEERIRVAAKP